MHNRSQCYGLEAASWLGFCCKPPMQIRRAHGTPMNRTDPKILCPIHFIPAVFHRFFFIINPNNTMHTPAIFLQTHFLKGASNERASRYCQSVFQSTCVAALIGDEQCQLRQGDRYFAGRIDATHQCPPRATHPGCAQPGRIQRGSYTRRRQYTARSTGYPPCRNWLTQKQGHSAVLPERQACRNCCGYLALCRVQQIAAFGWRHGGLAKQPQPASSEIATGLNKIRFISARICPAVASVSGWLAVTPSLSSLGK